MSPHIAKRLGKVWPHRFRTNATRLIRFASVGLLGTAVYYAALWVMVEKLMIPVLVATSIAFLLVTIENYVLHYKWTFVSTNRHSIVFPRFVFMNVIGFWINWGIMAGGLYYTSLSYLILQIFAIAAVVIWNFVLSSYWIFSTIKHKPNFLGISMNGQQKFLTYPDINSSHNLMLVIVLTLGVLNFFFGEIIQDGFSSDGVTYANMTRNLDSMISNGQLSNYYAHKVLPSAIVHYMLLFSGATFSDLNIIHGFELYNLFLLVVACWIWKRLANNFAISLGGRWIGFSGLFINFNVSKQAFFIPVLTDVTVLLVGLLLLLFYVEKRPIALFVTTVVGTFVWPLVGIYGVMLLLCLDYDIPSAVVGPTIFSSPAQARFVKRVWAALLVLSIIGLIFLKTALNAQDLSRLDHLLNIIVSKLTFFDLDSLELKPLITGIPSVAAVFIALTVLAGSGKFLRNVILGFKPRLLLIVLSVAAVIIPWGIIRAISNPLLPNANSFGWMVLHAFFLPPTGKLLLPFVTLTLFWGPLVLLLLLYWQAFCIELRKLGPGIIAVVGMSLPLGLVTEPRFITAAWPFMVFGLVLALEKSHRSTSFKYIFAILTVIYAQFWIKMNQPQWPKLDIESFFGFPVGMSFIPYPYGLWMSSPSYYMQLPIVILSTLWLKKTICTDFSDPQD